MLPILREIQRLWEETGKSNAGIARAAELIGESLQDVSAEADLYPGAPPSVLWEDGMVGLKCSAPPRNARPSPAAVAARCPELATLADLLMREDTFEALPWQYQAFLGKGRIDQSNFQVAIDFQFKSHSAKSVLNPPNLTE